MKESSILTGKIDFESNNLKSILKNSKSIFEKQNNDSFINNEEINNSSYKKSKEFLVEKELNNNLRNQENDKEMIKESVIKKKEH